MHHRSPRRWRTWPQNRNTAGTPLPGRFTIWAWADAGTPSTLAAVLHSHYTPDPLAELRAQPPGPDGIRQALVARIRQMIADGEYDTPQRWEEAQRRLFQHVDPGQ
ncbi:MAG: flagellar biosynthesis anti-sigma factor FlgM [Bacteroidales bacterium]|nr:flagellar biosynthesis anti-sigma factor FlgM [Bacteroidales bacterium]